MKKSILFVISLLLIVGICSANTTRYFRHIEERADYKYVFRNELDEELVSKTFCYRVNYDNQNRPIEITFLKMGNVRIDANNIAITKIKYDNNSEKRSYYNERGEETYRFHPKYSKILLEHVNPDTMLVSFFYLDNSPVIIDNFYYQQFSYMTDSLFYKKMLYKNREPKAFNGIYTIKYLYNEQNICVLIENLSRIGKLAANDQGIAKIQTKIFDGGKTRTYFLKENNELTTLGTTRILSISEEKLLSGNLINSPIMINQFNASNAAGYIKTITSEGYLSEIAFFDKNNQYTQDNSNVALYKFKQNDNGLTISKTCFLGSTTKHNDVRGVHLYDYSYDSFGNIIQELRLDKENKAVETLISGTGNISFNKLNIFDRNNGYLGFNIQNLQCYITKFFFDDYGYLEKLSYFEDVSKEVNIKDICGKKIKHDKYNNIKEESFINKKDNLLDLDASFSTISSKYDIRNNLIEIKYLKPDSSLGIKDEKYAIKQIERNYTNNTIAFKYFRKKAFSEKLILAKIDGVYQSQYTLDDLERIIRIEYFDENNNRMDNKDQYSYIIYSYDVYGNISQIEHRNSKENLVIPKNGEYAKKINIYNENNNMTSAALYDQNNNLLQNENGIAKWEYTYNEEDQLLTVKYYDKNNKLSNPISINYCQMERQYNINNNLIKSAFYDKDNNLINNKDGYAKMIINYTHENKVNYIKFFDENDEPTKSKIDNCAVILYKYNQNNDVTDVVFLDTENKMTQVDISFYYVAMIKYVYDENGKAIEKVYFDKDVNFIKKFDISKYKLSIYEVRNVFVYDLIH